MNNKITIITPTKNSEKTIKKTLDSVLQQSIQNFEYIIIDSKSTDSTLEIINSYNDSRITIISEPDDGISDAFNKGIRMTSGEIIGIINSDDNYYDKFTLENILPEFSEKNIDILYGNAIFKETNGKSWEWRCNETELHMKIDYKMCIPHPAVFVRRSIYQKIGLFDTRFKIGMDYDFILRSISSKARLQHLNKTIAIMNGGGVSDNNILKRNYEIELIRTLNNRSNPAKSLIQFLLNITIDYISSILRKNK